MHFIFAHLIGDFLLQTDFMAKEKKNSLGMAMIHGLFYMIPFLFVGIHPVGLGLIFLQHVVQDHSNFVIWFMQIKGSKQFTLPPMSPWSIIVTDNILHILWIAMLAHLMPEDPLIQIPTFDVIGVLKCYMGI